MMNDECDDVTFQGKYTGVSTSSPFGSWEDQGEYRSKLKDTPVRSHSAGHHNMPPGIICGNCVESDVVNHRLPLRLLMMALQQRVSHTKITRND